MRYVLLSVCVCAAVLLQAREAVAGLGRPVRTDVHPGGLKSSPAYQQAVKLLEEKGCSREQADAALARLSPERMSALAQSTQAMQAGGFLDLLLFILVVALIIYLIIVLLEESSYRRYGY
jgi:hypothetical protein